MRLAAFIVCVGLTLATSLHAQSPSDSTATDFHPGQWGVQAIVANGVSEAGALRFATPSRAWVLDGSMSLDRQTSSGTQSTQGRSVVGAALSVGSRWYHTPARLVRFLGLGLTGAYSLENYGANSPKTTYWSAGAYGEAGVVYMITPHIGLGSRAALTLVRTNMTTDLGAPFQGTLATRVVDYRLNFYPVQVLATIYF